MAINPTGSYNHVTFTDLFDIDEIQKLQDQFALATGVASVITEADGTPITKPSNFRCFCNMVRCTKKGSENCYKSDSVIGSYNPDGPTIQNCLSGGLWDAGANIKVEGVLVANWLIGQVRDENQTEEKILEYARRIGVNEDELIKAFWEVPYMPFEKFRKIADFLYILAGQLSAKAYQNIKLSRYIEEKKQAEEMLLENEQKFRLIFECAPYSIVINRISDYKFVDVNSKFLENNNMTREDVLLKTPDEIVTFCNKNDLENISREFLAKGKVNQYHYKMYKKNGELVHELASLYPITFKHEKCVVTILVDITKQIKAEETLQKFNDELEQKVLEQTEKLRLTNYELEQTNDELKRSIDNLNHAQDHIIQSEKLGALGQLSAGIAHELNTPLGVILSSSRSLSEFINLKFLKLLDFIENLRPQELKCMKMLIAKCIENPSQLNITSDRSRRREIQSLLESKSIENTEYIATLILKANLEMSFLESVSFFECENFSAMLTKVIEITSLNVFSKIIFNASEKASHVVGALRSYLKNDDMEKPEVIDIKAEIETVLTLFYNIIKHGITVEKKYLEGIKISGYRQKLNQVWMNIINNAIQAMNYKGVLLIETQKKDDKIYICFTDTGVGIPESIKDKIFEPFFTTKKRGEGIGLGLDICKSIIEKSGGKIYFESRPGKTKFTVELIEPVN